MPKSAKIASFQRPNTTATGRKSPCPFPAGGSWQVGSSDKVILAQLASWHYQSGGKMLKLSMTACGGVTVTAPAVLVRVVSIRTTVRVAISAETW